jgi:hypothetical protein
MNRVSKPVKKSPSEFRAQLLELNNLITTIPETRENDKMSELDLKYLFVEAMPSQWRRRFQEVGKKARSEPFDELAQFFDLFHNSETPKSENNQESSKNQRGNRNHNKSNSNGRLQDNDPCPIHGGSHKWIDCHDNKRGRNYKPFNPRNSSNDQHLHESNANNPPTSNQQSNNNGSASPSTSSDSDNPYNDEYNQESIQDVQDQLVPMTCIQTKQEEKSFYLSKTLLDSGGTRSSIARSKLPKGCKVIKKNTPYSAFSAGGVTHHDEFVMFDKLWLPEFTRNRWIENVEFVVFDDKGNSAYDVIIGRDLLERLGVDVKFSTKQVVWDDMSIPFVPRSKIPSITFEDNIPKSIQDALEDAYMSTQLKPSDYNTTTTGEKIAEEQTHLSPLHRSALAALLHKHNEMFSRILGKYPNEKVQLKLIPGANPIHCKPFGVPNKNLKSFKHEIDVLLLLDVLEPVLTSQWAFPTFLIPKKDGTARFVSDFRKLNQVLQDEQHSLPLIREVLTRRSGFDYVTIFDLTSQFYHFEVEEKSREYLVINTPFGKYRYKRLPMGIKIAPAFAQAVMTKLFHDLDYVECFIDDLAIFTTGTFDDHLKHVAEVLKRLDEHNFSLKPKKCHFAVKEVEYLGHTITPEGIRPQSSKVDAILKIAPPTNGRQLRQFIGMVNYYRDHIRHRSHLLAPLTSQSKNKTKINWTPECDTSFNKLKSQLAQQAMFSFPNPHYPYIIEPDASDYQLGSIILQNTTTFLDHKAIINLFLSTKDKLPDDFKPLAYFSRKLSKSQLNYTILDKELLSIVETLLEYRSFLLGSTIYVFTDHRNLIFNNNSQRAVRWRLLIEEFSVHFIHRAGHKNLGADAISRLPLLEADEPSSVRQAQERFNDSYLFYPVQDRLIATCPVSLPLIASKQLEDQPLQEAIRMRPDSYRTTVLGNTDVVQYRAKSGNPWKIVVPMSMVNDILEYFHRLLVHPGVNRMYATISKHFTFPGIKAKVESFVLTCPTCQRTKLSPINAGLLPLKDPELNPWTQVQVDLVGPWEFNLGTRFRISVTAFSAIDPFIGLCELAVVRNKTSAHIATIFHNEWLSRYPTPQICIHDNGPEFVAQEFQDVLRYYGIQDAPTTSKNPQANSIIERVHLTMGSMLSTIISEARENNRQILPADIEDFVDTALASTQKAINATVHSVTKETPGAFIFQRDMVLPIQSFANWELARANRSDMINKNLFQENKHRRPFDWQPGMQVLVLDIRHKLDPKYKGPFTIHRVHTNGTVTIRRGRTFERINIRRIKIFRQRENS